MLAAERTAALGRHEEDEKEAFGVHFVAAILSLAVRRLVKFDSFLLFAFKRRVKEENLAISRISRHHENELPYCCS